MMPMPYWAYGHLQLEVEAAGRAVSLSAAPAATAETLHPIPFCGIKS